MTVVPITQEFIEICPARGAFDGECWMMTVMGERHKLPSGGYYTEFYDTKEDAISAAKTWEMPIRFDREACTLTREVEEYEPLSDGEVLELVQDSYRKEGYLEARYTASIFGLDWESVKTKVIGASS